MFTECMPKNENLITDAPDYQEDEAEVNNTTHLTEDGENDDYDTDNSCKVRAGKKTAHTNSLINMSREDKTIESAVPFPAPEKGDNRGLSPFHPRKIIVIGECPLLSPEGISQFVPIPVPCLPKKKFQWPLKPLIDFLIHC